MADPTSPSPYSENKRFEPKTKVELEPPKNDLISLEELAAHDGTQIWPHYRTISIRAVIETLRPLAATFRHESGQASVRRDQGHHL